MVILNNLIKIKNQWSSNKSLCFYTLILDSFSLINLLKFKLTPLYFIILIIITILDTMSISFNNNSNYYFLFIDCFILILVFSSIIKFLISTILCDINIFWRFFKDYKYWINLTIATIIFLFVVFLLSFLILPALYCLIVFSFFILEIMLNQSDFIESFKQSRQLYVNNFLLGLCVFSTPIMILFFIYGFLFKFISLSLIKFITPILVLFFIIMYLNLYITLKQNQKV